MIFIYLIKWTHSLSKQDLDKYTKMYADFEKKGFKLQLYWTLGHYNFVAIIEAPSEKDAIKPMMPFVDAGELEVLTAIPRAEAMKFM